MSSALAITDIRYLEVGCIAWSTKRGYRGIDDEGNQIDPKGGVIVHVRDEADPETGETTKSFLTLNHTKLPDLEWEVLAEDEVNRNALDAAKPAQLVKLIRRLCKHVAMKDRYKDRTGLMRPDEVEAVVTAWRLAGLVA